MHVSCSSCGARYAVDPKAIGPMGRTVQCARCNHRWFQTIEPPERPPESPGTPPEPTPPPVPDIVIRPSVPGAGLPALAPQPRKSPWRTWLAVGIGLFVLLAGIAYLYRGEIGSRLPPAWQTILKADTRTVPREARLHIDLDASRIDFVDGRYVVTGEIANSGTKPGTTQTLKLTFRAGEQVVGQRSMPLVEGPIPPGGRARFSLPLDDPPAGTTNIVPTID